MKPQNGSPGGSPHQGKKRKAERAGRNKTQKMRKIKTEAKFKAGVARLKVAGENYRELFRLPLFAFRFCQYLLAAPRKPRIMSAALIGGFNRVNFARVAQLDRASASEAEGCGFNPRRAHQPSLERSESEGCRAEASRRRA